MSSITSGVHPPPEEPSPGRRHSVSIKDVARHAGVAQGTVSNVLNHPDRVSPARREAVERAIEELGFVRHEAARHLRAGYSHTLGLVLLDAWNPSFVDIAQGVESATGSTWNVLISNSGRDLDRERTYLRLFAEARVAGLIVIPHDEFTGGVHRVRAGGVPVVVVDRAESGDDELSVAVDDVAGGFLAARHLIELGHRRLAFVGDETSATPVHDRLSGVRRAVAEADGVELQELPTELTVDGGRRVGDHLAALPAHERPTGITAAIDLVAVGLLQTAAQHGLRVPEDLSVVGYDDIEITRQLATPLTTVRRPHHRMGVTAAEMLTATLAGTGPAQRHVVFEPELVVRRSTAPLDPTPGSTS